MHTASNSSGTYTFSYDALGRIATQVDVHGISLLNSYNAADDRIEVADSLGGIVISTFDGMHRLVSRTQSGTGVAELRVEIDYDGRGLREEVRRYNAATGGTRIGSSAYEYDDGGRLIGLDHSDGSSAPIVQYSYAYDEANRLTLETRNGVSKTYTYDVTNQLKTDGTKAYDYDKNGNRTMAGYEIEEANRITTDGIWTYTYSDTGAILAKTLIGGSESWDYTYDLRNQMLSATQIVNGMTVLTVTYTYDVFGYLVKRTETVAGSAASVTKFAYDIADRGSGYSKVVSPMWAELDASGNLTMRYFLGDSEGEKLARSNATEVTWMLTDRLGSVRELTDEDGAVGREISYNGFGNVISSTGSIDEGRFLFASYMWDSAVGLYNAHWRWYDASTGQWTSEDPIGFNAGDANIRRYVGNNATNATDPSGNYIVLENENAAKQMVKYIQNKFGIQVAAHPLNKGKNWYIPTIEPDKVRTNSLPDFHEVTLIIHKSAIAISAAKSDDEKLEIFKMMTKQVSEAYATFGDATSDTSETFNSKYKHYDTLILYALSGSYGVSIVADEQGRIGLTDETRKSLQMKPIGDRDYSAIFGRGSNSYWLRGMEYPNHVPEGPSITATPKLSEFQKEQERRAQDAYRRDMEARAGFSRWQSKCTPWAEQHIDWAPVRESDYNQRLEALQRWRSLPTGVKFTFEVIDNVLFAATIASLTVDGVLIAEAFVVSRLARLPLLRPVQWGQSTIPKANIRSIESFPKPPVTGQYNYSEFMPGWIPQPGWMPRYPQLPLQPNWRPIEFNPYQSRVVAPRANPWEGLPLRSNARGAGEAAAGSYVKNRIPLSKDVPDGVYKFVIDKDGKAWIAPTSEIELPHSALVPRGEQVRAAGYVAVKNGKANVNGHSGHYMVDPPLLKAQEAAHEAAIRSTFTEHGIDVIKVDPGTGLIRPPN